MIEFCCFAIVSCIVVVQIVLYNMRTVHFNYCYANKVHFQLNFSMINALIFFNTTVLICIFYAAKVKN